MTRHLLFQSFLGKEFLVGGSWRLSGLSEPLANGREINYIFANIELSTLNKGAMRPPSSKLGVERSMFEVQCFSWRSQEIWPAPAKFN